MDITYDLHIHSYHSPDGEFTPSELVTMCKAAGITTMAVSDHNSVGGVDEALEAAKKAGITCLPSAEFDGVYAGIEFHVLGCGIDHKSDDFKAIEQNVRDQCSRYSCELHEKILQLGFDISVEDMQKQVAGSSWDIWTGEDFAEVIMKDDRYLESEIFLPYRSGGSRDDNPCLNFYWDYCSQGKPCYAEIKYPPIEEILKAIYANGGYAVLAHPGKNLEGNFKMIDELIPLGIKGIEVYSSYHDAATAKWFYDKAIEKGLKITRGSDFHGKTKPAIKLGEGLKEF